MTMRFCTDPECRGHTRATEDHLDQRVDYQDLIPSNATREQWEWASGGRKLYGYPPCCVAEFVADAAPAVTRRDTTRGVPSAKTLPDSSPALAQVRSLPCVCSATARGGKDWNDGMSPVRLRKLTAKETAVSFGQRAQPVGVRAREFAWQRYTARALPPALLERRATSSAGCRGPRVARPQLGSLSRAPVAVRGVQGRHARVGCHARALAARVLMGL